MIACWFRTFVNLLDLIWTSVVCWVLSEGVGATIRGARLYIDAHAHLDRGARLCTVEHKFFEILTVMWAHAFSWWGVRLFSIRRTPLCHTEAHASVSQKTIDLSLCRFCLIYIILFTVVFLSHVLILNCCCFEYLFTCLIVWSVYLIYCSLLLDLLYFICWVVIISPPPISLSCLCLFNYCTNGL